MKKIELLDNETFTIKGVYGETYVFDGGTLFVDSSGVARKAVVIKSLRTERGAHDWLKTAGRAYAGAQVFDTETLKSFDGQVVTLKAFGSKDEKEDSDFDETLPFHVVSTEGGDDDMDSDEEMEALEREPGESEEAEDLMEDEEQEQEMSMTQIAQVLHDAQKLYEMIEGDEHLEPWMQAKLTKVAEYMNALAENLEHEDGDIPDEDGGVDGVLDGDDVEGDAPGLPPLPGMEHLKKLPGMPEGIEEKTEMGDTKKSGIKHIIALYEDRFNKPIPANRELPDVLEALRTGIELPGADEGKEQQAPEGVTSSVPAEPVMMSTEKGYFKDKAIQIMDKGEEEGEGEGVEEDGVESSVTGKVFKSLHAARQWNRLENPDKDRYYVDIMREKDARKGFSKSTGLNAKYVVRDRFEEEDDTVIKGAYGNKKMQKVLPPVKKIDPETLRVAAIKK